MTRDEVIRLQTRLEVVADGVAGPMTFAALFAHVGGKTSALTDALGRGAATQLVKAGVITPLRIAHFLAQGAVETMGFRRFVENLSYSAERMCEMWPRRFPTLASAQPFVHNPQALGDKVYGGRLGNTEPGDGYLYRGRGLGELTGRDNYKEAAKLSGKPLVDKPDLASDPETSVAIMCGYWTARGINFLADADDLTGVRRAINGGVTGLADAKAYLAVAKGALL